MLQHIHIIMLITLGKIVYCEIQIDKEGKSKGMGSVQFERPIEALNSIGNVCSNTCTCT